MISKYPLTCTHCSRVYKERTAYYRHKRLVNDDSICLRAQKSGTQKSDVGSVTNGVTVSNIDHSTVTVTNNIVNHGLPEWLDPAQFKESIEQVKKVIDLLEKKGIQGPEKTDAYIQKETYTYADFVACFLHENCEHTIRKVVELVQHLTPVKTARIAPLRILYEHMFESKIDHANSFQDLHRRPFHMENNPSGNCDILARDVSLRWEAKHWQSLLSDILFMLGKRIFRYMDDLDIDYLIEEPQTKKEASSDENEFYETEEQEQKAKKKRREKIKMKAEKDKAKEEARRIANIHPFVKWWRTIKGAQTLQDDPDVSKLMAAISSRLIADCKNDTSVGWHRLINYCRFLHERGDIVRTKEDTTEIDRLQQEINALQTRYDDEEDDELERDIQAEIEVKTKALKKLKKASSTTPNPHRAIRTMKVTN